MKQRLLTTRILKLLSSPRGRLFAVTGSRQTGKSTLLKALLPSHTYINLDDPEVRTQVRAVGPADLARHYPCAIFDEIQKAPFLMDVIKAAYDTTANCSYVLSGSSRILLLKAIRETLAGRIALLELYPLTVREIADETDRIEGELSEPMLLQLFKRLSSGDSLLDCAGSIPPLAPAGPESGQAARCLSHYLQFGGMPVLTHPGYSDLIRTEWLHDYNATFLQRDLADMARLSDLDSFVLSQKALAARSGALVNFSDVARVASVSPPTMKRYLEYLEISFMATTLPAWFRNPEKRLSKMPKLVFLDPGVCRALQRRTGDITGQEFESSLLAEIYKLCRTSGLPSDLYHLRTVDGREVDLLIELPSGFVGIEIKLTARATDSDARHARALGELLDKPLLGFIVLSQDPVVRFSPNLNALFLPAAYSLGATLEAL